MFDKLKDLWALKGQMEEIKKRLDGMVIKSAGPKGVIEIEINGSQEIKSVKIVGVTQHMQPAELEEEIKAAANKAIKDSLALAAQAMGGLAGLQQPNA